jgi:hypothetical protein
MLSALFPEPGEPQYQQQNTSVRAGVINRP